MAQKISLDHEAIRQVMLRELVRQGVKFGRVNIRDLDCEVHFIVHAYTEAELAPKYVESARLSNQIEDHLCPTCGKSVRTYDDGFTRTHTCDACGYHDVTFAWISD